MEKSAGYVCNVSLNLALIKKGLQPPSRKALRQQFLYVWILPWLKRDYNLHFWRDYRKRIRQVWILPWLKRDYNTWETFFFPLFSLSVWILPWLKRDYNCITWKIVPVVKYFVWILPWLKRDYKQIEGRVPSKLLLFWEALADFFAVDFLCI